jgi:predicted RecB family nuclease
VSQHLSKSRYTSGLQCPKLLWWKVYEPDAPELVADDALQALFTRGQRIGELARAYVPGGVLIDLPYYEFDLRVAATAKALADGAPVVYEACFLADGVFVAVDILERRGDGFVLVEVKSTLGVKEKHLADVAVQTHVVRRAGLTVNRAEVMHLNRECTYPDLSNLFVREDVTERIGRALRSAPGVIVSLAAALAGPLPEIATGSHCNTPYTCPFLERCWPRLPENHVSTLYRIHAAKVVKLVADGINTLHDLPLDFTASAPALRQIRSIRAGEVIVEGGLLETLAALEPPIAYLDFETISPAVPAWPGCHPCEQVPVQFSCHVLGPGGLAHHEWLAEGPGDPREELARALISACAGARTVVAFGAQFERGRIAALADFLPHLSADLLALSGRIRDLHPIVRDHVYHPDFGGSFSLKEVLPALVPGLGYDDLEIQDGTTASTALQALLLDADALAPEEQQAVRRALLSYCGRDTLAMVRLHERLGALAGLAVATQELPIPGSPVGAILAEAPKTAPCLGPS